MTLELHPFQTEFLEQASDGLNILWAPTGSGKTLALIREAQLSDSKAILYLTATPELVDQVAAEIRDNSLDTDEIVCRIARGKEYGEVKRLLDKSPRWIVATPGRLGAFYEDPAFLKDIDHLIIDEADHLLHADRLNQLEAAWQQLTTPSRVSAASASFRKRHLMALESLVGAKANVLRIEPETPKVHRINMIAADSPQHKLKQLVQLLPMFESKRGIIFCPTQSAADQAASKLSFHKIPAVALTGGKNVQARRKLLESFSSGKISWLVTTDIASRGIDIEGIEIIVHHSPPINVSELDHRNGRAGRRNEAVSVYAQCTANEWNKMAGLAAKSKIAVKAWLPDALAGSYRGPKKLKSSGKVASSQKRKVKKPAAKVKKKSK